MKGPKEMKRYVAKYREHLKACHWDDMAIFKWEKCKNWFSRSKINRDTQRQIHENS